MNWRDHITSDPDVCHGDPCFQGTRVMVHVVLGNLASGMTPEQLFAEYPSLPKESIPAALAFAAELTRRHGGAPASPGSSRAGA